MKHTLTPDESTRLLGGLIFEVDERKPPDNRRRGQFGAGWENWTVKGREYSPETLRRLTWHNLGYRLGRELGSRDSAEIDEAFERFADLFWEGMSTKNVGGGAWTDAELEVSVKAYLEILDTELNGGTVNKAAINRKLREGPLAARSKGSVELRMANISAVLDELGKPWIKGYLPRRNVGKGVKARLRTILENIGHVSAHRPEDRTADIAKKMFGEALYQRRARAALPILVRQATVSQKIYYADLAEELDMPNPRNLNYVLGSIGTTLAELAERWQEEVPPIQCLVINQQTGLPGQGIDIMLSGGETQKLDSRRKDAIVEVILGNIFTYPKWPAVLKELGLKAAQQSSPQLVRRAGRGGGSGESEAHRRLKEYVAQHPESVGLGSSLAPGQTEYVLRSGDIVDVLFRNARRCIAVEVKSHISDVADLERGLFQCVKYGAVLRACRSVEGGSYEVKALLAIEGAFPKVLVPTRNTLGLRVIESVRVLD